MKESKKNLKEQKIILSAEKIFKHVGFSNAKMEDIASEAGITKVTLYSYFQSKENLQLAVTHKALTLLILKYQETIDENRSKPGIEGTIAIMKIFIEFCEANYLYSEALLSYFALIRSTYHGDNKDKLSGAIKESIYFKKLQEIQNLPFKLTVREINRGRADGSVKTDVDPMLVTIAAWSSSIGYVKLISASGDVVKPLFNVDLLLLKKIQIKNAQDHLKPD